MLPRSLTLLLLASVAAADGQSGDISSAELAQKLQELTENLQSFEKEYNAGEEEIARAGRSLTAATPTTEQLQDLQGALNHMWLLLCGALVMFMQAGFALLEAGACRSKNVQNILMKNMVDVCAGTICWWAFGWAFAYGEDPEGWRFAGYNEFFGAGFMSEKAGTITPTDKPLNWFFQWAFCSAAATIVSGGVAERVNFPAYICYTLWMTTFIYPFVVAWTWSGNGWLQKQVNYVGYYDFAGSGIVHMCGGVAALTGAIVVGPRKGRFDEGNEELFAPHNLPLIVLGTFVLWFGWYGFNCGSTLGMADTATGQLAASVAMNTTISAAAGGITLLALRYAILRKYDVGGMCNGVLAGLVSITAGCGNVECGSAFVIGIFGALIYQTASTIVQKLKVDDPLDAFAVHGASGAWGVLAAVVFDWGQRLGRFHGWGGFTCTEHPDGGCGRSARGHAFAANAIGILAIAAWSAGLSCLVLVPMKYAGFLRASDSNQDDGLDVVKHSPSKAYQLESNGGTTAAA